MLLLLCWRTWKRCCCSAAACCCCCCCSAVKRAVKLIESPSEFTIPPSTTPLVVESRYKSSFHHPLVVESRFTCFLLVSSSILLLPCLNGRVTFQLTNPPSTTPLVVESRYKSSFHHPLMVESRYNSSFYPVRGRVTFHF
jgi:hypothetical protein